MVLQRNGMLWSCDKLNSPIFTELSTRFAQNDQPVTHRGVDGLHDLIPAQSDYDVTGKHAETVTSYGQILLIFRRFHRKNTFLGHIGEK